jgi:peptidoglycan-N-acetylglucosamine deacetylase
MMLPNTTPTDLASPFAGLLFTSLNAIEKGEHEQALTPLKQALEIDRNNIFALLTLGTLYLHTGSFNRASKTFGEVKILSPNNAHAQWGEALVALERGNTALAHQQFGAMASIPSYTQTAQKMVQYCRILQGEAGAVSQECRTTTEAETDALKIFIAGWSSLKGGNPQHGESLLRALLTQPEMRVLQESEGVVLLGEEGIPAQGGAATLSKAIELPQTINKNGTEKTWSGRMMLTPGKMPAGTATISYQAEGALSAVTNTYPFQVNWNTINTPNGTYTLHTIYYDDSHIEISRLTQGIRLQNTNAPAPTSLLTESERDQANLQVRRLLIPGPSRRAVQFALAERAIGRRDGKEALARIESVVAMDPQFKGAFQSLKRYHKTVGDTAPSIWKAKVQEKVIALTFDDGPKPDLTPPLLAKLAELGIPATFFVVGMMAERHPELVKQMVKEGHEIGNHTFTHPNLTYIPAIAVQRELCRTSALVRQITGKSPRFYRPPGGNFNGAVAECAEALGMGGGYWTIDVYKLERPPFGAKDILKFALPKIQPGSIMLMHNGPTTTIEALTGLKQYLDEHGYKCVTMSQLASYVK